MLISPCFDVTASPVLSIRSAEKLPEEVHIFLERIVSKEKANCRQVGSWFETSPRQKPLRLLEQTPSEAERRFFKV